MHPVLNRPGNTMMLIESRCDLDLVIVASTSSLVCMLSRIKLCHALHRVAVRAAAKHREATGPAFDTAALPNQRGRSLWTGLGLGWTPVTEHTASDWSLEKRSGYLAPGPWVGGTVTFGR